MYARSLTTNRDQLLIINLSELSDNTEVRDALETLSDYISGIQGADYEAIRFKLTEAIIEENFCSRYRIWRSYVLILSGLNLPREVLLGFLFQLFKQTEESRFIHWQVHRQAQDFKSPFPMYVWMKFDASLLTHYFSFTSYALRPLFYVKEVYEVPGLVAMLASESFATHKWLFDVLFHSCHFITDKFPIDIIEGLIEDKVYRLGNKYSMDDIKIIMRAASELPNDVFIEIDKFRLDFAKECFEMQKSFVATLTDKLYREYYQLSIERLIQVCLQGIEQIKNADTIVRENVTQFFKTEKFPGVRGPMTGKEIEVNNTEIMVQETAVKRNVSPPIISEMAPS